MTFEIKDIIESGRADNLIYVYKQLLDLRADFINEAKSVSSKWSVRLANMEQVVYPKDEVQAMVVEELSNSPFISKFFSGMLVSDILIEAKINYTQKLDNPTKDPNTDKLIDITEEELAAYVQTWYLETSKRKRDD